MNQQPPFLKEFNQISQNTHYRPSTTLPNDGIAEPSSSSPKLLLLFTWTGARPRHIAKYVDGYLKLFPSIHILLITTNLGDFAYRSSKHKQKGLQSALDLVLSRQLNHKISAHCFSDGGSQKAIQFARAYQRRLQRPLPLEALYLDSTPGDLRLGQMANAFKKSLPRNAIMRFLGLIAGHAFIGAGWVIFHIVGVEKNIITKTRRDLNDSSIWDTKAPRCYLYSSADDLIHFEDVENHALNAMKDGIPVNLVRFDNSQHCYHVAEDDVKYWTAVSETVFPCQKQTPNDDDSSDDKTLHESSSSVFIA